MNAKSIYDKLVNIEGVPSSILTYSDKGDCIIIEVQDYDKSVFKFAREFFKGYKSVDIDYTNENKTIVWYNEVSEYSDRETIDSITRFYYDMKVKGLVESKKSTRKSIKESSNFKKDYAVEVMGTYWLKPFYWYFNEFKDDLLIASEEYGFTYYITEATTTEYRINIKFNDNLDVSYDIKFRIIPRTDKATAKELNDYLN